MFGKRSDGKKIKKEKNLVSLMPILQSERHDSQNFHEFKIDCEPIDAFIAKTMKEKNVAISYMDVVFAAIVRMIHLRPQTNRFVMRGNVFQRNEISGTFILKKELSDGGKEITVKNTFLQGSTIFDVHNQIEQSLVEGRKKISKIEQFVEKFTILPVWALRFGMMCMNFMDRRCMLPKKIIEMSPYHSTFFLTNLKSIKTDCIFHHLYNFGTTGIFVVMGKEKNFPVVNDDGSISSRKQMPLSVTMDERFCDGFYWAKSLRVLKMLLKSPNHLQTNSKQVETMLGLKKSEESK